MELQSRVLSLREREALNRSLEISSTISQAQADNYQAGQLNPVLPAGMRVNRAQLDAQTKNNLKVLEEGSPRPVNGKERDELAKERDQIVDELKKNEVLETRAELHVLKRDNPNWHSSMDKFHKRPKWEAKIQRLQNICRTLEPENPEADSLHQWRKEK